MADRGNPMDTSLFDRFEKVEAMKEEWDRFMEEIGAEIFLSYDWCRTWWKHYGQGRELLISVFRSAGELVGILPLMRDRIGASIFSVGVVRLVGTDFSPFTTVFPVKAPFIDQAIHSLIEELNRKCKWEILHIGPICGCYEHQKELQGALDTIRSNEYPVMYYTDEVQTYYPVEKSWDLQVERMKQRHRTNTRKAFRELQSKGLTPHSTFATRENYEEIFDGLVQMHKDYWRDRNMPGHFGDWPGSYDFHKEVAGIAAHQGRLRLMQIHLNDLCIGYEYSFKFGNTYYSIVGGRIEYPDGIRIDHKCIAFREKVEKAVQEQVKTIDSMRGRYEYKLEMGGKLMPVYNGLIQSRDSSTGLKVFVFRYLAWALNVFYFKIWRRRVSRRLRLKFRPLWSIWIRTYAYSRL